MPKLASWPILKATSSQLCSPPSLRGSMANYSWKCSSITLWSTLEPTRSAKTTSVTYSTRRSGRPTTSSCRRWPWNESSHSKTKWSMSTICSYKTVSLKPSSFLINLSFRKPTTQTQLTRQPSRFNTITLQRISTSSLELRTATNWQDVSSNDMITTLWATGRWCSWQSRIY